MSYVIDTDGDLSTSNDINVFSYSNGMSDEYDKQDVEAAIVGSYYGFIGTQKVMFVTDGANIYYDLDGERHSVFDNSHSISSLNIVTQDGNPAFVWTQDNGDNSGNGIYYAYYDGEKWTSPVEIYRAEDYYFDALDIVNYNSSLVGVFMQAVIEYDDESEMYTISQSNLGFITITDYYDISVGCVSVEEEEFVPEQTAKLCVWVENKGTKTVNNVEFTIEDTLSNTLTQTQTLDIDLAPGDGDNVYLDYTVPSNFETTTLTVTANIDDDVNSENNSAQTKVGLSHISLAGYNLVEDGDYYVVTASVENKSLTEAEDITAKLYINEDEGTLYQDAKIESLSSSQIGCVTFYVEKSSVIFDEQKTAKLFCCFESESSKYGKTATECILITQSDSECGHPLTENRAEIAPTPTQTGHEAGEFCLCCNEYVSGGEEISAHTHTPETDYTVMKKATCTSDGYKAILCSECKAELSTQTISKRIHNLADTTQAKAATCTTEGRMNQKCTCSETNEYKACSYTTTRTVSALGHDKIKHPAKAATATEKGWNAYETCSRCNYTTYKEIPALGVHKINIDTSNVVFKLHDIYIYTLAEQTVNKLIQATGGDTHVIFNNQEVANDKKLVSGMKIILTDGNGNVLDDKTVIVLGDINSDGVITAADARLVLRASVELENLNNWQTLAANVDGGKITASDARMILRASVGLEALPLA